MIEILVGLSLSCSDYQKLIDNAKKSALKPEFVEEVVKTMKESAPDHCVFGQNDEST